MDKRGNKFNKKNELGKKFSLKRMKQLEKLKFRKIIFMSRTTNTIFIFIIDHFHITF
jgi:hypothetical protein